MDDIHNLTSPAPHHTTGSQVQDSIVHYGGFLIDDGGSDSPPPSSSSSSSDTGSTTSTSTSNSGYNSDSSKSISSKDFDKNSRKRNKYFQANGFYNESTKRGKHPVLKRDVVRQIDGVYCIRYDGLVSLRLFGKDGTGQWKKERKSDALIVL